MRLVLAAVATLALALPASAQSIDVPSGTYVNDPAHTSLTWKVSHFGFSTYTGMFARDAVEATLELDADDVAKSTLEVSVDTDAVRTLDPGDKDFNAEIASDMFLDAAQNPTITFTTDTIEVTGANTATITGELSLHGQTHPLTLDATLNRAAMHPMTGAPNVGITAIGTLKRSQYGINALVGPIGDDVTIEIQAEFAPQG